MTDTFRYYIVNICEAFGWLTIVDKKIILRYSNFHKVKDVPEKIREKYKVFNRLDGNAEFNLQTTLCPKYNKGNKLIYLFANRIETIGITRRYKYIVAILVGGAFYIAGTFAGLNNVLGFWAGFIGVLVLYKLLPTHMESDNIRREAIRSIADNLSGIGVDTND